MELHIFVTSSKVNSIVVVHGGSVVVDIAIIVGIIVVIGDEADVALTVVLVFIVLSWIALIMTEWNTLTLTLVLFFLPALSPVHIS